MESKKTDVDQLKGILKEFSERDVVTAIEQMGLVEGRGRELPALTPHLIPPSYLPRFTPEQVEYARTLFEGVQRYGPAKLPPAAHQWLGVIHLLFAWSTGCKVWQQEWQRICDGADALIGQGKAQVVNYMKGQLKKSGMPQWAQDLLIGIIDVFLELGEGELKVGLELARYAGKIGLATRCWLGL